MAGPRIAAASAAGRVNRYPRHTFQISQRPWQIQPMMIAPVLPGESMKNLLLQARVVSDPIKHPLIGWWQEYFFFYVKHRDLDIRDKLTEMMLDPDANTSEYNAAANPLTYHAGGTIDWAKHCLDCITHHYFRNENEDVLAGNIDGLPTASIDVQNWLDSAINDAEYSIFDGEDVDEDADGTITAGEIDRAMRMWQFQIAHKLTDMTYEDFLRTYGVRTARIETHKPELVRFIRDWTYPSNTVEPTTGVPSSALSWSIAERGDKDRFFSEPGFLFGVTVCRPKVYLDNVDGAGVAMMTDAMTWLPALMRDDPNTSLRRFEAGTGPLRSNTDAYWVDIADLLLYGDQFVNYELGDAHSAVALPTPSLQKRYAAAADADALFAGTAKRIRSDGVVSLTIAGAIRDNFKGTPTFAL